MVHGLSHTSEWKQEMQHELNYSHKSVQESQQSDVLSIKLLLGAKREQASSNNVIIIDYIIA